MPAVLPARDHVELDGGADHRFSLSKQVGRSLSADNNESGFTHEYYSGQTAAWSEPSRCLGITPEAWATGGPVSKPERPLIPREQIATLRTAVESLVLLGEIGHGEGNALRSKLDSADRARARNDCKAAANVLRAFQNQLSALVLSGRLLENRGRILGSQADRLTARLSPRS